MQYLSVYRAARIARQHGVEVTRDTLRREILPNMQQALAYHGKETLRGIADARDLMHRYMACAAYEMGAEDRALAKFHTDAFGQEA